MVPLFVWGSIIVQAHYPPPTQTPTLSDLCHLCIVCWDQSGIPVGQKKSYAKIVANLKIKNGISLTPRN